VAGAGLSFTPDSIVIDYCAGGGGKTLALAVQGLPAVDPTRVAAPSPAGWSPTGADELAAAKSAPAAAPMRLVACDVVQKRLDNIRPRLARAGVAADLRLIGQNGGGVEAFNGKADLVFVDAPCSGSGAWRRRPEDAWRLKADEIERLHALQLRILVQAAVLVKPGGRLVYVTCSVLARENEAVADAMRDDGFDERAACLAVATKRARTLGGTDPVAASRKLFGFLLRRGYNGGIARSVVKEVLAQ
jgi:16S rRNA (cytosine967-C5)-methyltransferase